MYSKHFYYFEFILFSVFVLTNCELPSYITKCKKSDPKFEACLIKNANLAVKKLSSEGGAEIGIPTLMPVPIPAFVFNPTEQFELKLSEILGYGIEDGEVKQLQVNFLTHTFILEMVASAPIWRSNYSGIGKLNDTMHNHHGSLEISFGPIMFYYTTQFQPENIEGEYYMQLKNSSAIINNSKPLLNFKSEDDKDGAEILANALNKNDHFQRKFISTVEVTTAEIVTQLINIFLRTATMCELFA